MYQFARDAAVAEAWLIAQEPYLLSRELGHTIDEVDQLIKKHESFEKSAAAQEERFTALERLTTVSAFFRGEGGGRIEMKGGEISGTRREEECLDELMT